MADKFAVKGDPCFPHHYVFTVGVKDLKSENRGKFFIKHGPIYFHHEQLSQMSYAFQRMEDEVFRQNEEEALRAEGVYELILQLLLMRMSAKANNCTIHHMTFENRIRDNHLLSIVRSANIDNSMLKNLLESEIRF